MEYKHFAGFYDFPSYEEMKNRAEKAIDGDDQWYIVQTDGGSWVVWKASEPSVGKSKTFQTRREAVCFLRIEFEESGLPEENWMIEEPELPALMGSPKQVAWADEIRLEVLRLLDRCREVVKRAAPEKWARVRNEYRTARQWVYREVLAAELIHRFRFITARKPDWQKIEDLKKGFQDRRLFNLAGRYWTDVTGEG